MICPHCKAEIIMKKKAGLNIAEDYVYCGNCGAPIILKKEEK